MPPVMPRPRPEIMGTAAPQAATSGASGSDILSPMPPVECLSTVGRPRSEKSSTSPERIMASVMAASSALVMPRKKTAMAKAAIW